MSKRSRFGIQGSYGSIGLGKGLVIGYLKTIPDNIFICCGKNLLVID